jgi:hypothetical protein
MKLLASNYKLEKSVPGHRLLGLSLAPHTVAGGPTMCPYSTVECRAVCLGTETGLNVLQSALNAKIERTRFWLEHPERFKVQLANEVHSARKNALNQGLKLAVRLNVYSDVCWEREYPELFYAFDDVVFYDYTKVPDRYVLPRNYSLTYSYSGTEASRRTARAYLEAGVNTAVVFPLEELPTRFRFSDMDRSLPVVNGDNNDFRPGDPHPCVVGLKFKGPKTSLVNIKKFVQQEVTAA